MGLRETLQMQMQEQSSVQIDNLEISIEALQTLKLRNSELQSANQNLLLEMEGATQQIIGLTVKLESATQTIQMLQSQNSEIQSENQNLLSQMMNASEQLELLTSRAASVNLIETENQKLKEEAEKSRNATTKAEIAAKDSADRLESEKKIRKESERKNDEEYRERLLAQELVHKVEAQSKSINDKYRRLFIGFFIFTVSLAVFFAYDHKNVLVECGQWFADRLGNIVSVGVSVRSMYLSLFGIVSNNFPGLTAERHKLITLVAAILVTVAVIALIRLLYTRAWKIRLITSRKIKMAAKNELKVIIIVSVSICLFYCCLFLREPIGSITTMNILSVWLILSAFCAFTILLTDIVGNR